MQASLNLRELLVDRAQSHGVTMLISSSDLEELLSVSHRIAVMNRGRIVQTGDPHEIYEHPRTRFVADFIGIANILPLDSGRATDLAGGGRTAWAVMPCPVGPGTAARS